MNSRELVIAATNHQPHERVPVDMGGTFCTGFSVSAYAKLRETLDVPPKPIRVADPLQMLAEVELPVIQALDADCVGIYLGGGHVHGWQSWRSPAGHALEMPANIELRGRSDGGWEQLCDGKVRYRMPANGQYFDAVEYPTWPTIDPSFLTDQVLRDIERRAQFFYSHTDKALVFGAPWPISNSTSADFMCALLLEKDQAHQGLEQWSQDIVRCLARLLPAIKPYVQVIMFSGDAGSQNAPLFSPEIYREMIVPHMRKVTEFIHNNSDMKVLLHSCGSVYRLIDSFIEMGMDLLNPLQLSAAEMEPERLVREFGGRIVFWGGGCDTQHVLPHGSPEQVRQEVRRRMKTYSSVPGFVFSPVHNIQADVPIVNILAMVDEVKKTKLIESC